MHINEYVKKIKRVLKLCNILENRNILTNSLKHKLSEITQKCLCITFLIII